MLRTTAMRVAILVIGSNEAITLCAFSPKRLTVASADFIMSDFSKWISLGVPVLPEVLTFTNSRSSDHCFKNSSYSIGV